MSSASLWAGRLGKSFWPFLDQGLFAFSNFALNVLLARWLTADGYGAFAVAFSIFLFFGVVFSGVMIEPMLVFGNGRYEGRFGGYLRALVRLHWKYASAAGFAGILLVALAYWGSHSFPALLALACFSGPIFYQWLMRRACYVESRPKVAACGGIIYLLVMAAGAVWLRQAGWLGAVSGVAMMAVASVAAAAWIQYQLQAGQSSSRTTPPDEAEIARDHWEYGKWAVASNVFSWIPGNLPLLLLPLWHGEAATGSVRAMFNLVMPVNQILGTLGPVVLVAAVRHHKEGRLRGSVRRIALVLAGVTMAYAAGLFVFGGFAVDLVYDGRYQDDLLTLWILGLQPVSAALILAYASGLRAMEQPRLVFRGYASASVVCLLVGIPLVFFKGAWGAAASMTLCSTLISFLLWRIFRSAGAHRAQVEA